MKKSTKIINTNLDEELLESIAKNIMKNAIDIVFHSEGVKYSKNALWYFTCNKLRKRFKNSDIIYYNGRTRFPYVNKHTGHTNIYLLLDMIKLSINKAILDPFRLLYNDQDIVYNNGPVYPIIKPYLSEISSGICYLFDSSSTRYTGYLSMSKHGNIVDSGEIEYLDNFSTYFWLLNKYYHFSNYTKGGDLLFLENWFNITQANELIKYITFIHHASSEEIDKIIDKIPEYIINLYEHFEEAVDETVMTELDKLPIKPTELIWKYANIDIGQMFIFDNKTPIRTMANKQHQTRVYLSHHLVPTSMFTDEELKNNTTYFTTGKIGNWIKPGLRYYTRANMGEYEYLTENNKLNIILNSFTNDIEISNNKHILGYQSTYNKKHDIDLDVVGI